MALLMLGSKGAAVRSLQILLNAAGYSGKLAVDADYGKATEKAVKAAQKALGLVVDGRAGPYTLTALNRAVEAPKANARPEPDKSAMLAVDNVIYADFGTIKPLAPKNAAEILKALDTARAIKELDWHCAATAEGKKYTVADIRAWHKARGFSDIGYHFVAPLDLEEIWIGRPIGQVGAHIEGHNTGTVGCCYIGGVSVDGKTPKDTRTLTQRRMMLWLTIEIAKRHPIKRIAGHNEFTTKKACPSFNVPKDELGNVPGFAKGKKAA